MMIKRIVGFVIMFTLMALAMEDPFVFFNVPSALIVFGLIGGAILASGRKIVNLFYISWSKNTTEDDLWYACGTYRYLGRIVMGTGYVGTLIGAVLMLGSLTDPAAIGPSLAIAILTILYAVILKYFIFEPIHQHLLDRLDSFPCECCEDKSDE